MSAIDILELVAFFVFAAGVALLVGALNATAGIGAGLVVLAVAALVWLIAYERGS